jgi:hypothetical protein
MWKTSRKPQEVIPLQGTQFSQKEVKHNGTQTKPYINFQCGENLGKLIPIDRWTIGK